MIQLNNISKKYGQKKVVDNVSIEIPEGKTIIDIVPSEIVLDNGKVVTDPVGNLSSNFTLKAQIILADKEYVRQLSTIFKRVGIEIDGIVPTALAERNLMLDTNELDDNVNLLFLQHLGEFMKDNLR